MNEEVVLATLTVVLTLRPDTLPLSAMFQHKFDGWPLGRGAGSLEAEEYDSACQPHGMQREPRHTITNFCLAFLTRACLSR